MDIGNRIISSRENKGWNQRELARRVNLNPSVMNRIESGDRPIKDHELAKLADVLDVTTDYLLGRIKSENKINVAGMEIELTQEEFEVFNEIRKHPIAFHDLASDPERKVKQLIKMWEFIKKDLNDDEDDGEGFGELED